MTNNLYEQICKSNLLRTSQVYIYYSKKLTLSPIILFPESTKKTLRSFETLFALNLDLQIRLCCSVMRHMRDSTPYSPHPRPREQTKTRDLWVYLGRRPSMRSSLDQRITSPFGRVWCEAPALGRLAPKGARANMVLPNSLVMRTRGPFGTTLFTRVKPPEAFSSPSPYGLRAPFNRSMGYRISPYIRFEDIPKHKVWGYHKIFAGNL